MQLFAIGEGRRNRRRRNNSNRSGLMDFLTEYEEFQEYMKMKKDQEKKAKGPEPRKFTFLETAGLCFIFGPWLGVGTLYGIKVLLHNFEAMVK